MQQLTDPYTRKLEHQVKQLEKERQALQYALGGVVDILTGFGDRVGKVIDLLAPTTPELETKQQAIRESLKRLQVFCSQELVDSSLKEWEQIQHVMQLSITLLITFGKNVPNLSEEEVDAALAIFESFIERKEDPQWQTLKERLLRQKASGAMPQKSSP